MMLRCFVLIFALVSGEAVSKSSMLRAAARAKSKAQAKVQARSRMLASAEANMKIRANLQLMSMKAKKYGMKLPWANLDADQGEEYEYGNQRDDLSDPKLFSISQYEHTSATDDADVEEEEDEDDQAVEDDSFKHGDNSELNDDDSDDKSD